MPDARRGDCPKCGDWGPLAETCTDCGCARYVLPAGPRVTLLHLIMALFWFGGFCVGLVVGLSQ